MLVRDRAKPWLKLAGLVLLGLAVLRMHAQEWSLEGAAFESTGGYMANGPFAMTGSLVPIADLTLTGGQFAISENSLTQIATSSSIVQAVPRLSVAFGQGSLHFSWSSSATDFVLEHTAALSGPNTIWVAVSKDNYRENGLERFWETPKALSGMQYYRLRKVSP